MSSLPPLPQANIPWLPPKPSPATLAVHLTAPTGIKQAPSGPLGGGVRLGLPVKPALPGELGSTGPLAANRIWAPPPSAGGSQSSERGAGAGGGQMGVQIRTGTKRPHSVLHDPTQSNPDSAASSSTRAHRSTGNPDDSTSTLPLPLPSKRFRKTPGPKAVLIPVEQLPVYPLPSPPPISDPVILETVFNHQSLFPRSKGRFEEVPSESSASRSSIGQAGLDPGKGGGEGGIDAAAGASQEGGKGAEVAGHYEKLEHVGDSLLGMIVTTWLHEDRPRLTCGTATKLKAHLVSNATLSHLSGLYGFPQRLRGAPDQLPVLRAQTDVRAALVEAYIAGVYFSYPPRERFSVAMGVLDEWLRDMYEPLYEFFFNYMRQEYETHHLSLTSVSSLPSGMTSTTTTLLTEDEMAAIDAASQGMANLLRTYCQRQGKDCRFEEERYETHCGILWGIKCFVDGKQVGEATRSGRRGAKNVAAWEGCKAFGLVEVEPATKINTSAQVDEPGTRLGPAALATEATGSVSHDSETSGPPNSEPRGIDGPPRLATPPNGPLSQAGHVQ